MSNDKHDKTCRTFLDLLQQFELDLLPEFEL